MRTNSSGDVSGRTGGSPSAYSATERRRDVSRRRFLAAAAAAVGAPAIVAAGRAAETTARGGLIDCQSHLFCQELVALMEKRSSDPVVFVRDGMRVLKMGDWLRKIPPHYLDVDVKLAAMDAAGVERTALSINDPGPEWFGDQEEMGFGVRVATPITEKNGGLITTSTGGKTAKATWGKAFDWCDYSGLIGDRRAGVTLLPDPANFRPSWFHNRDYGLMVANTFGRQAMKQGNVSRVEVKKGETLRLRFGVLLHSATPDQNADLAAAYRDFLSQLPKPAP